MFTRYGYLANGDGYTRIEIYKCDKCGLVFDERSPHYAELDTHYCVDCSFTEGIITSAEWLRFSGIDNEYYHAAINSEGEIQVWKGISSTPPWEMTNKDIRNSKRYIDWRKKVFERDEYTCKNVA